MGALSNHHGLRRAPRRWPATGQQPVSRWSSADLPAAVRHYEVGGKQVLVQWFNSRKREPEKPQIGDRRKPSPLCDIQPDHWLAEYTTELLNVLNILGLLVDRESQAAQLLERICSGPLITQADLQTAGAHFPEGFLSAAAPAQSSLDL
jgi:hypothetical protein